MKRLNCFGGFIVVLLALLVPTEGTGFAQTEDLRKELDAAYHLDFQQNGQ
jgi:hypothetical protein